jgi:hypothetical protein
LNFNEAIELLEAVSDFKFKQSDKKPDFCIYDNEKQGYTLCIKKSLVSEEFYNHLKHIVESRKLGIRESEEYLVIYGTSSLERMKIINTIDSRRFC